jgi:hypothetical protein
MKPTDNIHDAVRVFFNQIYADTGVAVQDVSLQWVDLSCMDKDDAAITTVDIRSEKRKLDLGDHA